MDKPPIQPIDAPAASPIDAPAASPITEADLHAYVDRQLSQARRALVEQYLQDHPEEQARVSDWQQQNEQLRAMLAPVLEEPVPLGLPLRPAARPFPWRACAAGVAVAAISAASAWSVR